MLTRACGGLRAGAAADRAPLPPWAVPPGPGAACPPTARRSTATFRRPRAVRPATGPRVRTRAAVQPPSAPPSPPIVSGGWRALPDALGPGSGAACVCGGGSGTGRHRARSPAAGSGREPGKARAGPRLFPGLGLLLGLRFLSSLHFVSLSAHGRLMEGRVHRPLYPARRASCALLPAFATGFGVPPCSSAPHTW